MLKLLKFWKYDWRTFRGQKTSPTEEGDFIYSESFFCFSAKCKQTGQTALSIQLDWK